MNLKPHSSTRRTVGRQLAAKALAAGCALGALLAAHAQTNVPMYRVVSNSWGGIYSIPVITSITPSGPSNAVITYSGMEGPYQVQGSADNANWVVVATNSVVWPNYAGTNTVPTGGTNAFFRLAILNQYYIGASKCVGCHSDKVNGWANTGHALAAWSDIADTNGIVQANHVSCLKCHTTGNLQPGGFTTNTLTPHLANVSCEACHGPAGGHVAMGGTRLYRPVPTGDPRLCGNCHNGTRHGDYDEWVVSPHAVNVEAGNNTYSCGFCHSGPVRNAMIANWEDMQKGYTNPVVIPAVADATNFGPTCVSCHDPHSDENPYSLRNPLWSTNYYNVASYGLVTYNTYSTNVFGIVTTNICFKNDNIVKYYDPTVQVCAQCHHARGGSWTSTNRGPHDGAQYNVFSGLIEPGGYVNTNDVPLIGAHGLNTNGCAACHMVTITPTGTISATNPVYHGHKFQWQYSGYVGCVVSGCHDQDAATIPDAMLAVSNSMATVQLNTMTSMSNLVAMLNTWALNSGSNYLGTNWNASKQYCWEYSSLLVSTNFGPAYPGLKAPSSSAQALLPNSIKQARYELYHLYRESSYGVHNPAYTIYLLNDISNKVVNTP
jgi:hypothetical protein